MINRRQGALVALAFALFSCTWTAFAAPVTSLNFSDLLHSFSQPPVNVRDLPLQDAIKTIQGNGKRTVYVVTDPDCRYCRQLDSELTQIKNVTIYRFEDPLTELHPNAANIAKQIWCAPDRSQAWHSYAEYRDVPANRGTCSAPIDANIALAARLGLQGTPALISSTGRLHEGTMPLDQLEKFIDNVN